MAADFKCPHCETEYEVAFSVGPRETGSRKCDSCGKEMESWTDAYRPIYVRKARREQEKKDSLNMVHPDRRDIRSRQSPRQRSS
jgi:transcription elongation factor Elf1